MDILFQINLDDKEIAIIKKDLNVKPFQACKIGGPPPSYQIYRESTSKLYLPRYYAIEKYGKFKDNKLSKGINIDIPFKGNLFDYQINIIQIKLLDFVGISGGGLLDVEPGKGKTVMALNIISKLSVKTLVVFIKVFFLINGKNELNNSYETHGLFNSRSNVRL